MSAVGTDVSAWFLCWGDGVGRGGKGMGGDMMGWDRVGGDGRGCDGI